MPVACVGAVIRDQLGQLLLVRRGQAPAAGSWSLPGGRVEVGESDEIALAREVVEETGLVVEVGLLVGSVRRPGPGGVRYDIRDYACTPVSGSLRAGSDAADARWVGDSELRTLACSPGLIETLEAWGLLDQR